MLTSIRRKPYYKYLLWSGAGLCFILLVGIGSGLVTNQKWLMGDDYVEYWAAGQLNLNGLNPYNPDQIFAIDLQQKYFIYDIVKQEKIIEFENTAGFLLKVVISQNGKYLAGVHGDMTLSIWNIKTGKEIKKLTGMKPNEIKFHPVTNELMVLNSDPKAVQNNIYIFDTKRIN